jgi:nucleotide-binding universal stress UspA family protein
MRTLLCLDGTNTERLAQWTFQHLNMQDIRLVLLHIVDSGPAHDLERLRQRFVGMGERGARLLAEMMQAEQEKGDEVLAAAKALLGQQWPDGAPGPDQIEGVTLRGNPEHEIVRAASAMSIDLILVCARRTLQQGEPPHPPGPKSVGHTARFVLDHAPCPVLLIRP